MKTLNQKIAHPFKGKIGIEELDPLEALVILSSIPGLGPAKIKTLLSHFGSSIEVLLADAEAVGELPGFGSKVIEGLKSWHLAKAWSQNLLLLAEEKAKVISFTDPSYPKRLLKIPDHPILLYIKGEVLASDQRSIAIIGTRQASIYGNEMALRFAKELALRGFTIVSGLARGIDTSAHLGALEGGRTIAVIGSGLSNIYPSENRGLSKIIATRGALISEFPMATAPDRQNFPQRNRIVAGMTQAVLLIEAPKKSGAMGTVSLALEGGKKIFTLPGRIDSGNFQGNHSLIKNGQAKLVESSEEIAGCFDDLFSLPPMPAITRPKGIPLGEEEEKLINMLPNEEISIEGIIQLTKLPIAKLNVLLMGLVLKRALKEFPGKVYKKHG